MDLSRREFEALVGEALGLIPEEFRPFLERVPVVVEDEAPDELLDDLGVPEDETLFGLYTGPSLPARGADESGLPSRIIVYRYPHLDQAWDREELVRQIAITVVHEVAHHFGIGEERLRELGWG
jgi:predicted Zn-dependent protease with MMP-like domain